jgi:hypothetical protein
MPSMGLTTREEQPSSSRFLSLVRLAPGRISLVLGVLFATVGGAPLTGQQPTPRDMFWSASDLIQVSANPGANPVPNPPPPPHPRRSLPTPDTTSILLWW